MSSANFNSTAWLAYRYVILGNVVSANNSNQSAIVYNSANATFNWYKLDIENVGGGGGGGSGHGYYITPSASNYQGVTLYYYNNVYAGTGGGGGAAGGYAFCTIYKNDIITAFNAIYNTGSSGSNLGTSTLKVTAYTGCGGRGGVCANNSNGTNGYSGGASYIEIDMTNGANTKTWQFAYAGGGGGGYLGTYLSSQSSSKTGLCYTPQESNTGTSTQTVGNNGLLGMWGKAGSGGAGGGISKGNAYTDSGGSFFYTLTYKGGNGGAVLSNTVYDNNVGQGANNGNGGDANNSLNYHVGCGAGGGSSKTSSDGNSNFTVVNTVTYLKGYGGGSAAIGGGGGGGGSVSYCGASMKQITFVGGSGGNGGIGMNKLTFFQ